jgi:hypothetical protein
MNLVAQEIISEKSITVYLYRICTFYRFHSVLDLPLAALTVHLHLDVYRLQITKLQLIT